MKVRRILFWLHLLAGIVAGIVILIMSVTGAAIAFEKEMVALAEQKIRKVAAPASGTPRLSLDELLSRAEERASGARPSVITVFADPQAAVSIGFGRTNAFYANPYTGEVHEQAAQGTRAFMHLMTDWHRWLGQHGEGRAVGKAMTGACNLAFLLLSVSGIFSGGPANGRGRRSKASPGSTPASAARPATGTGTTSSASGQLPCSSS
ncbi:MAG TPA: PepSY-associated TM helix domain-containing protein [Methylomirabilota bacterium]|nr:PepSY-associated TM helix domain-containing protein [Methylomirabilota bacterium]